MPVVVRRYELATDSAGAGRLRGGMGMRRDIQIFGEQVRLTSYAMRQVIPPPGIMGGRPGSKGRFVLNPDAPEELQLPVVISNLPVPTGAVLSCQTPGGGGLGPPEERPREKVHRDLVEGRISAEAACRDYEYSTPARDQVGSRTGQNR